MKIYLSITANGQPVSADHLSEKTWKKITKMISRDLEDRLPARHMVRGTYTRKGAWAPRK